MQMLSLENFTPYLNKAFTALTDGNPYFILIEARPLASPPSSGMIRAPFSLLFRNALPILFMQKIYRFQHPTIGELGIFLVPVARDRDGFLYQAIFN